MADPVLGPVPGVPLDLNKLDERLKNSRDQSLALKGYDSDAKPIISFNYTQEFEPVINKLIDDIDFNGLNFTSDDAKKHLKEQHFRIMNGELSVVDAKEEFLAFIKNDQENIDKQIEEFQKEIQGIESEIKKSKESEETLEIHKKQVEEELKEETDKLNALNAMKIAYEKYLELFKLGIEENYNNQKQEALADYIRCQQLGIPTGVQVYIGESHVDKVLAAENPNVGYFVELKKQNQAALRAGYGYYSSHFRHSDDPRKKQLIYTLGVPGGPGNGTVFYPCQPVPKLGTRGFDEVHQVAIKVALAEGKKPYVIIVVKNLEHLETTEEIRALLHELLIGRMEEYYLKLENIKLVVTNEMREAIHRKILESPEQLEHVRFKVENDLQIEFDALPADHPDKAGTTKEEYRQAKMQEKGEEAIQKEIQRRIDEKLETPDQKKLWEDEVNERKKTIKKESVLDHAVVQRLIEMQLQEQVSISQRVGKTWDEIKSIVRLDRPDHEYKTAKLDAIDKLLAAHHEATKEQLFKPHEVEVFRNDDFKGFKEEDAAAVRASQKQQAVIAGGEGEVKTARAHLEGLIDELEGVPVGHPKFNDKLDELTKCAQGYVAAKIKFEQTVVEDLQVKVGEIYNVMEPESRAGALGVFRQIQGYLGMMNSSFVHEIDLDVEHLKKLIGDLENVANYADKFEKKMEELAKYVEACVGSIDESLKDELLHKVEAIHENTEHQYFAQLSKIHEKLNTLPISSPRLGY